MSILKHRLGMALIASAGAGFAATWGLIEANAPSPVMREYAATYAAGADGARTLIKGWSKPEAWGVWSEGPVAELDWHLKGRPLGDLTATVEARSFSPPGARGSQLVDVVVNGAKVVTLRFNTDEMVRDGTFPIPAKVALSRTPMRVTFMIDRPTTPRQSNATPDDRPLGLGLQRFALKYQPAEIGD